MADWSYPSSMTPPMYSSHDVNSDTPQPISPPETIPPDVPPHVNQSCRHHSVSRPANVSSNSATTGTGIRLLPPRLSGILGGKIPLFRRAPRLASENQVATVTSSASAQPSRTPSSPILDTTPHGRGSQASASADHAQNVAERPVSSSKLSNIFSFRARRKQQQTMTRSSSPYHSAISPLPPGLLSRRALQEAGSDTPLRPEVKELGEQNPALLQAHSSHKRGMDGPCLQQVGRTPSDQPSGKTCPSASLNYPDISASPSSSRSAQLLGMGYAPRGPLPEKPKALRVEGPSKSTRLSNEREGRAPPDEHHPKNPSVTLNDQVHMDPRREPNEGPSSSGNHPKAVANATADVSAIFNTYYEPPAISRYERNARQTSPENRSTIIPNHKVSDPEDANGDVIANHSEYDNCEVIVDADNISNNSSSWPKSESISNQSCSTGSIWGTGSSENGLR